ncbi:hypothetical protein ACH427_04300 [Streptomyces sp. NPDC020379]|uniref:hypothetical protein n=1 Tax=Streptomyces sp. NPDC020379 TaxID=3365071 RepID=UPI0037AA9088
MTIAPLRYTWDPAAYCLIGYATSEGGLAAVIGTVAIPGRKNSEPSLMDVAARHQPTSVYGQPLEHAQACWLICAGWSSSLIPKPGCLEFLDAAWKLERQGTVDLKSTMYGHDQAHIGRFVLTDPELRAQAVRALDTYA